MKIVRSITEGEVIEQARGGAGREKSQDEAYQLLKGRWTRRIPVMITDSWNNNGQSPAPASLVR